MTDAITAPANNYELDQNETQISESDMTLAPEVEENRDSDNEYFVLGYN